MEHLGPFSHVPYCWCLLLSESVSNVSWMPSDCSESSWRLRSPGLKGPFLFLEDILCIAVTPLAFCATRTASMRPFFCRSELRQPGHSMMPPTHPEQLFSITAIPGQMGIATGFSSLACAWIISPLKCFRHLLATSPRLLEYFVFLINNKQCFPLSFSELRSCFPSCTKQEWLSGFQEISVGMKKESKRETMHKAKIYSTILTKGTKWVWNILWNISLITLLLFMIMSRLPPPPILYLFTWLLVQVGIEIAYLSVCPSVCIIFPGRNSIGNAGFAALARHIQC